MLAVFLKNLPLLLSILVTLAEQLHPQPGSGAEKAKFVLNAVNDIASNHTELVNDVQHVVDSAKPLLEDAVKELHTLQQAG